MKNRKLKTVKEIKLMILNGEQIGSDISPAMVKEICSELMKLYQKSHPPVPPESPCRWRLSDELQRARLTMPEPTRVEHPYRLYVKLCEIPPEAWFSTTETIPSAEETIKIGTVQRKKFRDGGAEFWAWTEDGKKPIFPIPMENEL